MTAENEEAKQWMAERIKARQQAKKTGIQFSVTEYQDMKSDGMSDAKIVAKYGTNVVELNKWKKEHNLIGKHNLKTIQKEQGDAVESASTTNHRKESNPVNVDYKKFCETKDKEIFNLKKVNERQLADNQKLAEENTKLHKQLMEKPKQDPAVVDELKQEVTEPTPEIEKAQAKPAHYHTGSIDVIRFAKENFSTEERRGFYRMNVLKYVTRYHLKDGMKDLTKAQTYLQKLFELESD